MTEHDFEWRSCLIATQRAFRQSFSSGFRQIGLQFNNVLSRIQEVNNPESAFFPPTIIERHINPRTGLEDLYWQDYEERSIDESMTTTIALARLDRKSKDRIQNLYAQRAVFRQVRDAVLNLAIGQSVNFLVPRGLSGDVTGGTSLGQIENTDSGLVQTFQLLPLKTAKQIQNFQNAINQDRTIVPMDPNVIISDNFSPQLTWITVGKPIDYKNELLGLIDQAVQPNLVPTMMPEKSFQFQQLFNLTPIETLPSIQSLTEIPREIDTPIPAAVTADFLFDAAAATSSVTETAASMFVVNKTTSGSDPEVTSRTVLEGQVVFPTTEVSLVRVAPAVQPGVEAVVVRAIWPVTKENLAEEAIIYQARIEPEIIELAKVEQLEPTEQEAVNLIAVLEVESRSSAETERIEIVELPALAAEPVPKKVIMVESEQKKPRENQTVRIETMPHRDKTVLPIWEIKMQGISLDDIPEWNLSSVLIGEDLGWSMTVPGLKAEEELETNAERAFKLGKWSEFDYLKKTTEVVETILLVIVNTNWEQLPRLRRRMVKDFGGDWGSGSVKYRQIQR